jgi:putative transposase
MGRTITTFKTAIFRLHNPSKRRCAMLDQALRLGHQTYTRALSQLLTAVPSFAACESKRERDLLLANALQRISARIIMPTPMGNAAKAGLLVDLDEQVQGYLELLKKQPNASMPTVRRMQAEPNHWAEALDALARSIGEGEARDAANALLTEARAGTLRPLTFPRNGMADGFLLLQHAERGRFGVWLNLFPASSRFYERRDIYGWADVRKDKVLPPTPGTGALFPIDFGAEHQLARFVQQGRPKSAKLVKKVDRYEVHVAFAFETELLETVCWLGVDRGIHNLVSLCVIDSDGRVLARENVDGKALRFVQRKEERRQQREQQQGRHYRSSARRAMADEAVHHAVNRIVAFAAAHRAQVVIERLDGLKKSPHLLNRAQFGKVERVLAYKLSALGLPAVMTVVAAGTSQTCPECGLRAKENREKRAGVNGFDSSRFRCISCNFTDDADLNAARVIGQKKMWRKQLPAKLKKSPAKELPAEHSFECFLRDCAGRRSR